MLVGRRRVVALGWMVVVWAMAEEERLGGSGGVANWFGKSERRAPEVERWRPFVVGRDGEGEMEERLGMVIRPSGVRREGEDWYSETDIRFVELISGMGVGMDGEEEYWETEILLEGSTLAVSVWTNGCSPAASGVPSCDLRLLFTGGETLFGREGLILSGILNDIRLGLLSSGARGASAGVATGDVCTGDVCISDVLRVGRRVDDHVDGGGKSPTKDWGRSPSSAGIGGGIGTFESCFSFVLLTALRFGSL